MNTYIWINYSYFIVLFCTYLSIFAVSNFFAPDFKYTISCTLPHNWTMDNVTQNRCSFLKLIQINFLFFPLNYDVVNHGRMWDCGYQKWYRFYNLQYFTPTLHFWNYLKYQNWSKIMHATILHFSKPTHKISYLI